MEPAGQPCTMTADYSLTPCGSFVSSDWSPALFPATHPSQGHWQGSRKIPVFGGQAERNRTREVISYLASTAVCQALHWVLCKFSVISLNFLNIPTRCVLLSPFCKETKVLYCQGYSKKEMAYSGVYWRDFKEWTIYRGVNRGKGCNKT